MSRWDDNGLNCDFKAIHCKLEQFERDLQSVSQNGGSPDCDMSIDGLLDAERGMEDRIDLLQRELDALDDDGGGSSRGRKPYRTQSPGELCRMKGKTRSYQNLARPRPSTRRSYSGGRGNGCNCKCNSYFETSLKSDPERDSQLHELRQQLRDVNSAKRDLQERIFTLEEEQRQADNDTQMLKSQLEGDRIKCRQMEEDNEELQEEIRRLEVALNNLPVGESDGMRDAAEQITSLLQTLNDDMVKAPDLCNRLRMAAQQIMEGERRLSNEKGSRAVDQVEVQYLRNENQRLRELAFRANMSAFQASVQLPQNQYAGYNQAIGPPFGPGGACFDPYGLQSQQQSQMMQPRRKSMFQRMFGKKYGDEGDPGTLQFQDGSQAQFDPTVAMNNQRLSMAMNENPEEAAKRLALINQENQKGCCGK